MSEKEVPQELVAAILVSFINSQPVLISQIYDFYDTETQICQVLDTLTQNWTENNVLNCKSVLTFQDIKNIIKDKPPFTGLLFKNIDKLSHSVQCELAEELMHPHGELNALLKTSVLVFSSECPDNTIDPSLTRHIVLQETIGPSEDYTTLVELPSITVLNDTVLSQMRDAAKKICIVPELLGYMQDIIIFIRNNRFSRVGLNPNASLFLDQVTRSLCVLRGSKFATPMMIKDAARLVLPLQMRLSHYSEEPSLMYGGDMSVARVLRNEVNEVIILETLLKEIPVPR